ncbi:MAG: DNA polymerase domain-containing protein, partial [Candidatus Heimdallarchaeaceae archaeon]
MTGPLYFTVLSIDFFIKETKGGREEPVIRIKGKDEQEKIIVIHATGFYPYFYISDLPETKTAIQTLLQHQEEFSSWIKGTEHVKKYTYYQLQPKFLYKISGTNPWKIRRFCQLLEEKGIKCYENDIPYISRFLIDTKIRGLNLALLEEYEELEQEDHYKIYKSHYSHIKPVEDIKSDYQPIIMSFKVFIDTSRKEGEVAQKTISGIVEEGQKRIIAISLTWGREGEEPSSKHFVLESDDDESEKELIQTVWKTIHQIAPDVLVSFNGNKIDLPYILKRMKKFGLPNSLCTPFRDGRIKEPTALYGYRIAGYMVYDISSRTRWMRFRTGQEKLANFVEEYLGKERTVTTKEINELWIQAVVEKNADKRKRLEETIDQDTRFIFSLFIELGFDEWIEVMKIVGIQPSKGIYSTARHLGEFELIRVLHHKDTIVPTYPSKEERERRKADRTLAMGGYVMVPQGTLHEAVLIADFSSMYPSVIVAHNIGGESFIGITHSYDKRFVQEPDTGLRIMERKLLSERRKIKQQIQELEIFLRSFPAKTENQELLTKLKRLKSKSNALKVIANSMYGSHNYIGSRFFNTDISNAITHFSKAYIEKIARWTTQYSKGSCEVIYGDTDSTFIKLANRGDVFAIHEKVKKGYSFTLDDVPEAKDLLEYFNSKLPKEMALEFVDLATRIVFAKETKKRYSYISAVTGKLEITG